MRKFWDLLSKNQTEGNIKHLSTEIVAANDVETYKSQINELVTDISLKMHCSTILIANHTEKHSQTDFSTGGEIF
jgi:hypothetical protein